MSALSAQKQFDDTIFLFVDSNDQSLFPSGIELILKIVKNILSNPDDEKFRKIKFSNKLLNSKLLCLNNGEVLLLQTGFVKENDEYILHPDEFLYNHLVYIRLKLEKFIDKINGLNQECKKSSIITDSQSILAVQQILQFIQQSNYNDNNDTSNI